MTTIGTPERLPDNGSYADPTHITRALAALVFWGCALAFCYLLASRQLGITWDDRNYWSYFQTDRLRFEGVWQFLIEEPLWRAFTSWAGPAFGPEEAFRGMLFLSPLGFLLGANKILTGAWLRVTDRSWFLLIAFIAIPGLAISSYVAALRQGVATSAFMVGIGVGLPALGALGVGALIHTAFLGLAPAWVMLRFAGSNRTATTIAVGAVIIYAVALYLRLVPSPIAALDLGRRATTYVNATGLNWRGMLAAGVTYGLPLLLIYRFRTRWIIFASLAVPTCFILAAANAGFLRLFLTADALMLLAIGSALPNRRGWAAGALFIAVSVSFALWAGRNADPRSSLIGLWSFLLGGY